jgi:Ca-activated chloride channel family protein
VLTGIDLRSLSFAEPLYLWLLPVPAMLLALWVWQVWRRRLDARRSIRDRMLPVRERFTLAGDLAFWLCVIVAATLCIVALARPQARVSAVTTAGADVVILQDGSASMWARDVRPDRWQRSVQFIRAFAEALGWKGDRVALAIFAHLASPQTRLTRDPNALFFFLDHLSERSPFRLEDDPTWDTNIEEGLYWGLKLIETDEQLFGKTTNAKAFVVISDGQSWSGNVANALAMARERQTAVYVVGVGTTTGGVIPEPVRDESGVPRAPVRAVLDRDSLRAIARAGGGEYFEIGQDADRDVATKIIRSVRRRATVTQEVDRYEDVYWRFLFAAGVFLSLGTLLIKRSTELWWQAAAALVAVALLANAIR